MLSRIVSSIYGEAFAPLDLKLSQFSVLAVLSHQGAVALDPRTGRGARTTSLCDERHRNERRAAALGRPAGIRRAGRDGQTLILSLAARS